MVSNWLCGGASTGGSSSLSKIWDLASHRALVTGEWYIPGHKLRGFLAESARGEPSKGEVKVEPTGMVLEGEELESMEFWVVLEMG